MDLQAKGLLLTHIANLRLVSDFEIIANLVEDTILSIKLDARRNSLNNLFIQYNKDDKKISTEWQYENYIKSLLSMTSLFNNCSIAF